MLSDNILVLALFLATFLIAIAIGLVQYRKAKKARREHHQSADARVHGESPRTAGEPSVERRP